MFCCDGKDASMIFCPEFFVDALWWPRPYPQLKSGAMWQCQSKRWSHELVQVLHVHNLMFVFVLANGHCRCFFPPFCHKEQPAGWVTLAPCCRMAMSTASPTSWWSSSANLIRMLFLDVGSMYMMNFWTWYDKPTCPEEFTSCAIQQCVFQISYSQLSYCVALDSADPTNRFAVLRREVGPSENPNLSRSSVQLCHWMKFYTKKRSGEATKIMPKISAAMHLQCFMQKLVWNFMRNNFTFRRWIICGPTSRSGTTATSKTATWSSGSYGRAHRWCWRTPVIWRFLIWNRRCIPCSRCRGWDGIVVWFVEICCLGCL